MYSREKLVCHLCSIFDFDINFLIDFRSDLQMYYYVNHHRDSSHQKAESRAESVNHCDVNDALVALNLWHSAGNEPRIGTNRRCSGLRPLAGSKQNVCDNKAECITSWKTVCLWLQVCACVCVSEKTETHSSACFNVSKNVCVCEQACLLTRQYVCFLHHKAAVL